MSKAFLRESDFEETPASPRPMAVLPEGARNYLTEEGAEALRQELDRLSAAERPPLAAYSVDGDARRKWQRVDQRIRYLQQSLRSAEIVPAQTGPADRVRFGHSVTVREPDGTCERYRIVGVDETALGPNGISWQSPLAKALLNGRVGERVQFKVPAGPVVLEIVAIE
jgi:transcription elongation factor GreB